MLKKSLIIILILPLFALNSAYINHTENNSKRSNEDKPPFQNYNNQWVDSVFNTLSEDERISQLFMIAAYTNNGNADKDRVKKLITNNKIGGIIFFQGGPVNQAILTNYYQSQSKTPLLIAQDSEWGLSMRLDSTIKYPRQMSLGAIQDESLLYNMGTDIAEQCRRIGVHVNFAPVIDINNNAKNPVINSRSFGENKYNVTRKGFAYMAGMQDNKIIATAKHFPGHGDTDADSHYTLPVIKHNRHRLDSLEFYPFKELINNGLGAVMTAHLHIPALDNKENIASSLSRKIITDILQKEMQFKGLIFTDALGMKGVADHNTPGEVAKNALLAGNDILLMCKDVPAAIKAIKKAMTQGLITQKEIDRRVRKILHAKAWVGLDNYKKLDISNIHRDLHKDKFYHNRQKLVEAAVTLVENRNKILPIGNLDSVKIAVVSVGRNPKTEFQKTIGLYAKADNYNIARGASMDSFDTLLKQVSNYDIVIVGVHRTNEIPKYRFGVTKNAMEFVSSLSNKTKVVLNLFANPYSLSYVKNANKLAALVVSYEDSETANNVSAQIIFGGMPVKGRLPVTSTPEFRAGYGISTDSTIRLKYSVPLDVGIDPEKLKKIDTLALNAIKEGQFPGCQVLAVKDGTVFFWKTYGWHTYKKKRATAKADLYDLASITKIAATLPAVMQLSDSKQLNINSALAKYIPKLDSTNKKKVKIRDVLTHQARLNPWIPFYLNTISKNSYGKHILDSNIYRKKPSDKYCAKVADNVYIDTNYVSEMYEIIFKSKLRARKKYRYSDLGFLLMQRAVENITKTPLNEYVERHFYNPLGANTLCFNPLSKFKKTNIVPTELDTFYRRQLLQGYVHDFAAAMMGGVAGHAGLFSDANDLAKLMQLYLQDGNYGGVQFFKKGTVKSFSKKQFTNNRRGLGFDKPTKRGGTAFKGISAASFGHSGFTGTTAWIDPDENIVYIFLSNRVCPVMENKKIIRSNIRQKIQKTIYEAIIEKKVASKTAKQNS